MRPFNVGVAGLSEVYFHLSCLGKITLQLMVDLISCCSMLMSCCTSLKLLLEMKS